MREEQVRSAHGPGLEARCDEIASLVRILEPGYGRNAEVLRKVGESGDLEGFKQANAYGTPDQILGTLESRRKVLGNFEQSTAFRFGAIPYDQAETSMRLFAKEVLPVLKTWD
jgi:hypothetical protein